MLRVLVLVDGSKNSDRAVKFLIQKIPLYKEPLEIHLLNVQVPIASGNVKSYFSRDQIADYYQDEGVAALKSARKLLDAAGIQYAYHIGVGEVGDTVARYIKEKKLQQIVMGTRGLGSVSGMLLGSVATKVMHSAEVPVLLVK